MGMWDDITNFLSVNTKDVVLQSEGEKFDFFLDKILSRVRLKYNNFNRSKAYPELDFALDKDEKHVFINTGSRPIARIDIIHPNDKLGLILSGLIQRHHHPAKENVCFAYEKNFNEINSKEEDKIVKGIFEGLKKIVISPRPN